MSYLPTIPAAVWSDAIDKLIALVVAVTALLAALTALIKVGGIRKVAGDAKQQSSDAQQQAGDAQAKATDAKMTAEVAKSKTDDMTAAHFRNADDIRSLNEQTTKLANQLPPPSPTSTGISAAMRAQEPPAQRPNIPK